LLRAVSIKKSKCVLSQAVSIPSLGLWA
jgi:hypothetical protein